jgi:hypothetical protein
MTFKTFAELERERKNPLPGIWYPIITIALTILIFGLVWVSWAHAEIPDMAIIQKIESNGNPNAYNKYSGARGLHQITAVVLQEYNQFNKTRYTKNDLFNAAINTKIANWYMNIRITQLLKAYRRPLTLVNYQKYYNAGIRSVIRGYMPAETANYIKKYNRLAKEA